MEPGHEDREYTLAVVRLDANALASMEPGHEDREYMARPKGYPFLGDASMEPGHEDREYRQVHFSPDPCIPGLNGARS